MKKIMIYAYTRSNLGDDLFIKILCERYSNARFYLFAPQVYKNTFKNIKNLTIFSSDTLVSRAINFSLRKLGFEGGIQKLISMTCDAVVYIGGSLFIQGIDWRKALVRKRNYKLKNKSFYLLGANFGPYSDKNFFLEYKRVFKKYTDICFRDTYSYNLFKNDLNNVRLASDIVFQLETKKTQFSKNVLISVIKPSYRHDLMQYDDEYYLKIKDLIIFFIEKGYTVTLMGFCEGEKDDEAIKNIKKLIPKDCLKTGAIKSYIYRDNIEKALSLIGTSCLVIATRFHAMILGWIYNKSVFPIVYNEKMTHVMKDVGFKGMYAVINKIQDINPQQIYDSMRMNKIDVSEQIKDSEKQFEKLDRYLN